MKVFISVGRAGTNEQRLFIDAFEQRLYALGLQPHTIGRNTYTSGQPLERIRQEMEGCVGIAVIAYERYRIEQGVELAEVGGEPEAVCGRRYPTPWHHAELGMAYMLNLPVLVIAERGLHLECLLDRGHGWFIHNTPLSAEALRSDALAGVLNDWIQRLREKAAKRPLGLWVNSKRGTLPPIALIVAAVLALWMVTATTLVIVELYRRPRQPDQPDVGEQTTSNGTEGSGAHADPEASPTPDGPAPPGAGPTTRPEVVTDPDTIEEIQPPVAEDTSELPDTGPTPPDPPHDATRIASEGSDVIEGDPERNVEEEPVEEQQVSPLEVHREHGGTEASGAISAEGSQPQSGSPTRNLDLNTGTPLVPFTPIPDEDQRDAETVLPGVTFPSP